MLRPVLNLEFDSRVDIYLRQLLPVGFFDYNQLPSNALFITGGFIPRLYHGCPIRDIDFFCTSDSHYSRIRALLCDNSDFTLLESPDSTQAGRAYLTKFRCLSKGVDIDLVRPSYALDIPSVGGISGVELEGFIKRFDFTAFRTVTTRMVENRWIVNTIIDENDINDAMSKTLKYTGNLLFRSAKNNSLLRMAKYMSLGFSMGSEDYQALVENIHSRMDEECDEDHAFVSYGSNQGDMQ
jgi:hypothetical protein